MGMMVRQQGHMWIWVVTDTDDMTGPDVMVMQDSYYGMICNHEGGQVTRECDHIDAVKEFQRSDQ